MYGKTGHSLYGNKWKPYRQTESKIGNATFNFDHWTRRWDVSLQSDDQRSMPIKSGLGNLSRSASYIINISS
jgi:hypothetical protein